MGIRDDGLWFCLQEGDDCGFLEVMLLIPFVYFLSCYTFMRAKVDSGVLDRWIVEVQVVAEPV